MQFRILALFLTFQVAAAGVAFSLTARDTANVDLKSLNLEGHVDSKVSDTVTVGGRYNYGSSSNKPEEIYLTKTFADDEKNVNGNVEVNVNVPEKSGTATATVNTGNGDTFWGRFSSNNFFERAGAMKSMKLAGDRQTTFAPTYDHSDKTVNVDVDQEIDGSKTRAFMGFKWGMEDDSKTDAKVSVAHRIDDNNEVEPSFSMKNGYLTYKWRHNLSPDSKVEMDLDPKNNCEVEWTDRSSHNGEWVTHATVPVDSPKSSTLSFKRKFNLM
jgi:hypothetical protein